MRPAILLLLVSAALSAQTMEGTVYDALTGAPVAGALVTNLVSMNNPLARTDAAGHFRLLAPSYPNYSLQVSRAGYVSASRGFMRKAGQSAGDLRLRITPAAVISGKLVDDEGSPIENAQVMALRYETIHGRRKLQPANAPVQSDDQGDYRISGLTAGSYYVRANAGELGNWDRGYMPEYYRGGLQPVTEGLVEVKAGEERGGIDVRFTKHEGVTVEGRVTFADGTSAPRIMPMIFLEPDEFGGTPFFSGRRSADGTFRFSQVPAGSYTLELENSGSLKAGDLYGRQRIEIGTTAVRGAVLTVRELKPVEVSGTVLGADGRPARPMLINLGGQSGPGATTHSNEDGTFTIKGVLPGHYEVRALPEHLQAMQPAMLLDGNFAHAVSARLGDKEVLESGFDIDVDASAPPAPLEIRISDHMCKLSGKLFDAVGKPLADAVVMIAAGESGVQGAAVTSDDGAFVLIARTAGQYRIYAITNPDTSDTLDDPAYRKAHENDFPAAALAEGENQPLTLRLPPAHDGNK